MPLTTTRSFWPAGALLLGLLLPALPAAVAAQAPAEQYVVREGDQLRIRVWPDSTLGGVFPVEDDGSVYLPVIGQLEVAGTPLSTLRRELRDRYGAALKSPTVSVTPLFRVSVLGAVQRPGLYEVTPTQSVIDAISLAGGFREDAKENRVRVLRDGEEIEVSTERLMASGASGGVGGLRSGDRIVVPRGWSIEMRDVLYVLQSVALVMTLVAQSRN